MLWESNEVRHGQTEGDAAFSLQQGQHEYPVPAALESTAHGPVTWGGEGRGRQRGVVKE